MDVCDVVPFPPDPKLEWTRPLRYGLSGFGVKRTHSHGYESRGPAAKLECLSKSRSLFSGQRKAVLLRSPYMRF